MKAPIVAEILPARITILGDAVDYIHSMLAACCCFCQKPVSRWHYCLGCKSHVCETCDKFEPTGQHTADDHVNGKTPEEETGDAGWDRALRPIAGADSEDDDGYDE